MAAVAKEVEAEFPMQESTVLENKIDRAQGDVAAIKTDVKVLQSDVAAIKVDVRALQTDGAVLKADVKVLRSDVNHIQEDVTDLKTDMKRIDAKVDAVGASLTEHRIETEKSFAKVREDMKDGFAALRAEITASRIEMKEGSAALHTQIAASRIEMKELLEKFRDRRFTKIAWVIGTVIALIGIAVGALKVLIAA
jgi:chromosome segregation ATPase